MNKFRRTGRALASAMCIVFMLLGLLSFSPGLLSQDNNELYSELTDLETAGGSSAESGKPDSKSGEENNEQIKEVDLYFHHSKIRSFSLFMCGNKKGSMEYFSKIESLVMDITTPPPKGA